MVGDGWWVGGGRTKTKLMLNSTQVEVKVEVRVELGNFSPRNLFFCSNAQMNN